MILYTGRVESIRNVTQLAGMIFQIHGGAEPGSAACIDMTGQMNAFTSGQK